MRFTEEDAGYVTVRPVVKAAKSALEGKTVDGKALSDRVRDRLSKLG